MNAQRIANDFAACEETVRRRDPDRYFSALFAPPERRPLLFALYAFNHEIARVAESVREPMMADIRLQWWREAAGRACGGEPDASPVAAGLKELFARTDTPFGLLDALLDARALDAGAEAFADMAALEAYVDSSSGNVMRIAARTLGMGDALDGLARAAGIGFGLTGLLRALPFHAARRKLFLPLDLVAGAGLKPDEIFAGKGGARLKSVMSEIAARARAHLEAARAFAKPGPGLAAVLPAATVPGYLKLMSAPDFDPFVTRAELPLYRRQLAMVGARLRGQV